MLLENRGTLIPTVTEKIPRLRNTSGTNREIESKPALLYDAITRMTRGAIYVVTHDQRYLNLLRASAESLKQLMPDLPITVFSQFPVEGCQFNEVKMVEPQ